MISSYFPPADIIERADDYDVDGRCEFSAYIVSHLTNHDAVYYPVRRVKMVPHDAIAEFTAAAVVI